MSDFVFDPTKQYGWYGKCTDLADDEFAKMALEGDARRFIPDEYMDRVKFFCKPMVEPFDHEDLAIGFLSWLCWRYTPPPLILNDDVKIKVEVKP